MGLDFGSISKGGGKISLCFIKFEVGDGTRSKCGLMLGVVMKHLKESFPG